MFTFSTPSFIEYSMFLPESYSFYSLPARLSRAALDIRIKLLELPLHSLFTRVSANI
jgi:hypothetical protein